MSTESKKSVNVCVCEEGRKLEGSCSFEMGKKVRNIVCVCLSGVRGGKQVKKNDTCRLGWRVKDHKAFVSVFFL